MNRNSWLGCTATIAGLLLSTVSFADITNEPAAPPNVEHGDTTAPHDTTAVRKKTAPADDNAAIGKLKRRIEQDDATIRGLARRIERLEHSDTARLAATGNAGHGGDASSPTAAVGLRAPDTQIADIGQSPSDLSAQVAQATAPAQPQQGQFEVSAEAAQHALERALVQTGALLLRPGQMEIVPSVLYQFNQTSRPDQLVLTSGGTVLVAQDQLRNSLIQSQVLGRVGLPWEMQLEVATSYDYASSTTTSQVVGSNLSSRSVTGTGLGDSSVSLIKQVTHEAEWLPSIFVSGTANLGQQENGLLLGTGFDWFKAAVVAVKRQDPVVFTAGFAYQTNLASHGVLPGDEFIPSVGMIFALSPQTSIQAVQQVAFINDTKFHHVSVPGSSEVQGIFQAGILSILAPGVVVDLTAAVSETPSAPDLTVELSLPIRFDLPVIN